MTMKGITEFKSYRTRIAFDALSGRFVQRGDEIAEFTEQLPEGSPPPCACLLSKKGDEP